MNFKAITLLLGFGIISGVVTSCASNELPAQQNPAVVGGYTRNVTFNYISDANYLSYMSPRVRTIVYVAQQNPSAVAVIRFNSINAKDFSKNLQNILEKEGVKTELIGYADKSKEAEVSVYVKFKPLDEVLTQQQRESEMSKMTNITAVVNGYNPSDDIVITNGVQASEY